MGPLPSGTMGGDPLGFDGTQGHLDKKGTDATFDGRARRSQQLLAGEGVMGTLVGLR